MKGEALQYLGKNEEAESVLEIANTLEPEGRRQIEENTGTTTYSTNKGDFSFFFYSIRGEIPRTNTARKENYRSRTS